MMIMMKAVMLRISKCFIDVSGKIEDILSYSFKKMGLPTWLANKIAWTIVVVFL